METINNNNIIIIKQLSLRSIFVITRLLERIDFAEREILEGKLVQ